MSAGELIDLQRKAEAQAEAISDLQGVVADLKRYVWLTADTRKRGVSEILLALEIDPEEEYLGAPLSADASGTGAEA